MLYFPTLKITSVQEYRDHDGTLPPIKDTVELPVRQSNFTADVHPTSHGKSIGDLAAALFYVWGETSKDILPLVEFSNTRHEMLGGKDLRKASPPNLEKSGSFSTTSLNLSTPYCLVTGEAQGIVGTCRPFRAVLLSSYYMSALEATARSIPVAITLDKGWVQKNYFQDGSYCGPPEIPCSMTLDHPSQQSLDGLESVAGSLYFAYGNAIRSAKDLRDVSVMVLEYAPYLLSWPAGLISDFRYLRLGDCPVIPPLDVLTNVKTIKFDMEPSEDTSGFYTKLELLTFYLSEMRRFRECNLAHCLVPLTEHPFLGVRSLINARVQGML